MIDEIAADYDNRTLEYVRWEAEWLCQRFNVMLTGFDIYQSSEGNYHLVLKLREPLSSNMAVAILSVSSCSRDYLDFVEERGFTRRVSSKKNAPKPRLMESWTS